MPISTKSLHILALFLASAIAAPAPQSFPPPYCQTEYTVDTQEPVQGDLIVGDYTVSGGMIPSNITLINTTALNKVM